MACYWQRYCHNKRTSRTHNSSHNCGVHSCEKKRSKKMKLLISGKKWIKGIVRTTSKIRKIVCKLLFERRTSNKLGDKFRVLWGNFQTCPLPVQLHKTKRPGGQGPSRSPSGLDPSKWQNPQGRGTAELITSVKTPHCRDGCRLVWHQRPSTREKGPTPSLPVQLSTWHLNGK